MKVRDALNNPSSLQGMPVKDERRVSAGAAADFRTQLEKADTGSYEQRLEKLVADIVKQGEKLGKKVDIRELWEYKNLISEFLEVAVGSSRKFSKHSLLDRRGRHKVYALIKKINAEVDQLTQEVMNGEKDNIDILRRIDDIRGLILDMMM